MGVWDGNPGPRGDGGRERGPWCRPHVSSSQREKEGGAGRSDVPAVRTMAPSVRGGGKTDRGWGWRAWDRPSRGPAPPGGGRWARKRRTCHLRIHFGENPASTYFAYLFNLHISVSDDFHLRLCMRTMVIYYAIYRNKTKRL